MTRRRFFLSPRRASGRLPQTDMWTTRRSFYMVPIQKQRPMNCGHPLE